MVDLQPNADLLADGMVVVRGHQRENLATSSGYDILDEQARIAASRAKQMAEVPPELLGKAFELRLTLGFNLDENVGADPVRMRLQAS